MRIKAFPKVRELFERLLADGKRVALASSAKQDELKEAARIGDLIDTENSSDDAEKSKPPRHLRGRHEAAFGHSACGRRGGRRHALRCRGGIHKAGLRTIGPQCGGWPEEALRRAGCVALYQDPADLLKHHERSSVTALRNEPLRCCLRAARRSSASCDPAIFHATPVLLTRLCCSAA